MVELSSYFVKKGSSHEPKQLHVNEETRAYVWLEQHRHHRSDRWSFLVPSGSRSEGKFKRSRRPTGIQLPLRQQLDDAPHPSAVHLRRPTLLLTPSDSSVLQPWPALRARVHRQRDDDCHR